MKTSQEKWLLGISMAAVAVFYLFAAAISIPLHTTHDELGAIWGAASLAGLDWSGLADRVSYYGFGYFGLFFWVFKLTDDPTVIYRVVGVANALLKTAIVPIAWYIGRRYLRIRSVGFLCVTALLLPLLHTHIPGAICNEYPLEFLFWVTILLACKVVEHSGSKRGTAYWVALFLCLVFLLTVHTRSLVILIAVGLTLGVFLLAGRKRRRFLPVLLALPLLYWLTKQMVTVYQQAMFGRSGAQMVNGAVTVSDSIDLLSPRTWQIWLTMLLSILDSESIVTGGLFVLTLIAVIWYLVHSLRYRHAPMNRYLNTVLALSVLCAGGTFAGFLISNWFSGIYTTWDDPARGTQYAYKALTYIRYWDVYLPPAILCGAALFERISLRARSLLLPAACLLFSGLQLFFIYCTVPLIDENKNSLSTFYPLLRMEWVDPVDRATYYKAVALASACFLLAYFLFCCRQNIAAMAVITLFVFLQCWNCTTDYDARVQKRASEMILASYEEKSLLDEVGIDIGNIYVYDTREKDRNWTMFYIAQFYFNRYTIQPDLPSALNTNDIVICPAKADEIEATFPGVNCYQLDENEVWYTYLALPAQATAELQ